MILQILNWLAAAVLLGHSACALNHMTRRSSHMQRCAYLVLACGAASVLLGPVYGYRVPAPAEVLVNVGAVAVLLTRVWLDWRGQS